MKFYLQGKKRRLAGLLIVALVFGIMDLTMAMTGRGSFSVRAAVDYGTAANTAMTEATSSNAFAGTWEDEDGLVMDDRYDASSSDALLSEVKTSMLKAGMTKPAELAITGGMIEYDNQLQSVHEPHTVRVDTKGEITVWSDSMDEEVCLYVSLPQGELAVWVQEWLNYCIANGNEDLAGEYQPVFQELFSLDLSIWFDTVDSGSVWGGLWNADCYYDSDLECIVLDMTDAIERFRLDHSHYSTQELLYEMESYVIYYQISYEVEYPMWIYANHSERSVSSEVWCNGVAAVMTEDHFEPLTIAYDLDESMEAASKWEITKTPVLFLEKDPALLPEKYRQHTYVYTTIGEESGTNQWKQWFICIPWVIEVKKDILDSGFLWPDSLELYEHNYQGYMALDSQLDQVIERGEEIKMDWNGSPNQKYVSIYQFIPYNDWLMHQQEEQNVIHNGVAVYPVYEGKTEPVDWNGEVSWEAKLRESFYGDGVYEIDYLDLYTRIYFYDIDFNPFLQDFPYIPFGAKVHVYSQNGGSSYVWEKPDSYGWWPEEWYLAVNMKLHDTYWISTEEAPRGYRVPAAEEWSWPSEPVDYQVREPGPELFDQVTLYYKKLNPQVTINLFTDFDTDGSEIAVFVYRNGKYYDTVTVSAVSDSVYPYEDQGYQQHLQGVIEDCWYVDYRTGEEYVYTFELAAGDFLSGELFSLTDSDYVPELMGMDAASYYTDGQRFVYGFLEDKADREARKVDEEGNPIAGAVFGIYHSDGQLLERVRSDMEGRLELVGLKSGNYYLLEEEAPEGYVLAEKPVYFRVLNNGKLAETVEIVNVRQGKTEEPTGPEPTEPEPTKPEPTGPEPTEPETTKPEPTEPEPTEPEPMEPEPTEPEPTEPEPTEPEPTEPEPTESEPSETIHQETTQGTGSGNRGSGHDEVVTLATTAGDRPVIITDTLKAVPGWAETEALPEEEQHVSISGLPKTGESSWNWLYLTMLVVSFVGTCWALRIKRSEAEELEEACNNTGGFCERNQD